MKTRLRQGSGLILFALVLIAVGFGIQHGVEVTDTQETVGSLISGAGVLMLLVCLAAGAAMLIRGEKPEHKTDVEQD